MGKRSWEKFVPEYALTASIEYRLAVLQGLMDSNGYADERGRCYFTSTSRRLATGVRRLVWSLGGKARTKSPTYLYSGEKLKGRTAYEIYIALNRSNALFRLTRKKQQCRNGWNGGYEDMRAIVGIEEEGEEECTCIKVASLRGLFLVDDYIVTHNTEMGIVAMALPAIAKLPNGAWAHPYYQGLVLRRHSEDLKDWNLRAGRIYHHFGARQVGRPAFFRFPSGGVVFTGHLKDEKAVSNYLGSQYQRMLVEEVTLIPTEQVLERLMGSLRSIYPALQPQILLTTNPGGPGHQWVRSRYVRVYDADGNRVPPGVPFQDPRTGYWRIFIPAKVEDNPILCENDPAYVAYLDGLEDNLRRAWRDGDWDSFAGQFFGEFRPEGPIGNEAIKTPWANHVVQSQSVRLEPWWYRWGSGDWGHDHPSVFHWYCQAENGQVHVYRELSLRQCSPMELGAHVATATIPDLQELPEPHMSFSIDPRCWAMVDEGKTIAQRIAEGIDTVAGKGTAMLLKSDGEPMDRGRELDSGAMTIVIRQAANARAPGWAAVREALRWRPLFNTGAQDEVLPQLQIHGDACPLLIDTIPVLVYSETRPEDCEKLHAINGVGGDDAADSLRYGIMAHRLQQNVMPLQVYMAERMRNLSKKYDGNPDPTMLAMVSQHAYFKYFETHRQAKAVNHRRMAHQRRQRV